MTLQMNREGWLTEFAKQVEPVIRQEAGLKASRPYRIACGWPSRSGKAMKNRRIGECQVSGSVKGVQDIFISPTIDATDDVAHVVVHELLHAMLPPGAGHRKPFSQAAKKVGLEGKPTATVAGEALAERLKAITDKLGPYPHDRIAVDGMPKQIGRLLKAHCPLCGYIVRITAKWIEEAGCPVCPQCNVDMIEADTDDEASDPLVAVDQVVEYAVKPDAETKARYGKAGLKLTVDPRFSLKMHRKGREMRWYVIDYGDDLLGVTIPRLTPAETRQDAIDLLESLRAGLLHYDDLDKDTDDIDVDFEGESDPQADWNDLQHLDEDEDEHPDYEDGYVSPEEEAAYAAEQANREQWVEAA